MKDDAYLQFGQHILAGKHPGSLEAMYESVEGALVRYEYASALIDRLRPKSILDFGAGNGYFWEWMFKEKHYIPPEIVAVENFPPYIEHLRERLFQYAPLCRLVENLEDAPSCEMVLAIGSLNYRPISSFIDILNILWKKADRYFLIETNIQSPQVSSPPGIYNPSLQTIYDWLYERWLQYGGSRQADIHVFKKYTVFILVDKAVQ